MWKRGGRSSALDRAQGLLSTRRSGGGAGTLGHVQGPVQSSVNSRSLGPSFSDLSDDSSVSLAAEPEPLRSANAGESRNGAEDLGRPQSSLGGRSRFLKKPPPPTGSSQSQERPEPRCAPSSQRSSQTAALSRLAAIESRIRVRKQAQDEAGWGMNPANTLASDISPAATAATRSPVASEESTSASSGDHRLKGSHFLKSRATGAAGAAPSESADVGVRFRTAEPAVPSGRVEREPMKVMNGVSLESDEEDMKRLLGDSLGSSDRSLSPLGPKSSIKKQDEKSSRSSRRVNSTPPPAPRSPPPAAASRPPSSPHRRPNSPPRRQASPFRFTGQARVCFSPSVLSPPPSPPPAERPGSSGSLSSASGRGAALSLEELFPARPHCEEPHSDASSVSSADFNINVMSLDELVPATFGSTTETPRHEARREENKRESKQTATASTDRRAPLESEEVEVEEEEVEVEEFYQADFESESRSVQSASQVSEDVQGAGDEEEVVSAVSSEDSNTSCSDYSSAFSERSRTPFHRSRDSKSSTSSRTWTERARRPAAARRTFKEAAVQTQPDPLTHTGWSGVAPALLDATPVLPYTLRAETVETLSTFNPTLFTLNEMLKQQLASITGSFQSSQQRHSRLLQSLEPPDYRYTTLEDVQQMMKKRRAPPLTLQEALEEVLQEMNDCFCT